MMFCTIWYFLYNLKNVKNTQGCNCTKSNTPPWVSLLFFKLCKCYQIAQRTQMAFQEEEKLIFCECNQGHSEQLIYAKTC